MAIFWAFLLFSIACSLGIRQRKTFRFAKKSPIFDRTWPDSRESLVFTMLLVFALLTIRVTHHHYSLIKFTLAAITSLSSIICTRGRFAKIGSPLEVFFFSDSFCRHIRNDSETLESNSRRIGTTWNRLKAWTHAFQSKSEPTQADKNKSELIRVTSFCKGTEKAHKLTFQDKLFATHPNPHFGPPEKKFMCLISWGKNAKQGLRKEIPPTP